MKTSSVSAVLALALGASALPVAQTSSSSGLCKYFKLLCSGSTSSGGFGSGSGTSLGGFGSGSNTGLGGGFSLPTATGGFSLPTGGTGTGIGSGLPTTPASNSAVPSAPAASSAGPAPTGSTGGGSTGGGSSTGGSSAYTGGSTANDVSDNNGCTPLTVIFARGTSEGGNVGSVAGPPMFEQLVSDLGATGVSLQGVDYPASAAGNVNCGADGGSEMADLVATALQQCPGTKIALSGYSQGACVVHNAVQQAGVSASSVSAVVLFGDPFNGQSVGSVPSSSVLEICADGDSVCNGSGTFAITAAHLTYGNNAEQAASFIEQAAGVA